jgi:hypothetical protein
MKKLTLIVITLLSFCFVNAQNVVIIESNGSVVIRTGNGTYVKTVLGSGAADAALNSSDTEVVITHLDGKVTVRSSSGVHVGTVDGGTNARSARWSGNDIIITYNDGKVIKRSKTGTYISTIKGS